MAKVTRITLENSGSGPDKRRLHLREISLNGDTPLESIGQDLRQARQRKGEDLAQISRVLKIRKDLLEAIEESNIEALPGRAYVIGFVRSYAEYLGLDANNAVERLKAEIAGRGDGKESPTTAAPPAERKSMPSATWIFGGLLILVLIYSVYYLIVAAGRMTSQPVIPVPERLAEQAGITSPPSAEQPAPPATDPAALVTVRALPAPTAPAPVAVTPAPAPAAVAPPPPLPAGQKYGAQNVGSRITLRVHRPALVNVRGRDDRLFMNRHLNPGDTYLVPNVVGLQLTTPDAGAVELILDGSSVGFVGRDGADASNVSLNPNDVADRQRRG
jgi:cytoskeleton protein RodZ